jgi:acyl transferase domain-containing protein
MSDTSLHDEIREKDIAVIGMSGRFPGAPDLDAFWQNLREGHAATVFFTDEQLRAAGVSEQELADPNYVRAGVPLDGVEHFDAGFFGYSPGEAELLDPQQRLFLEHAWATLERAGYTPHKYNGLIGVYAGVAWNTYLLSNLTAHPELFAGANGFQVFIANDKDFMPTRVSYKLNLRGPSMIVQTSCSTSLVAIHLACLSLLTYECDMALAGGVTVKVPQQSGYVYQEGGLASPDGYCRTFDADAQGTIFGSGIGVVALKRLADAIDDGDTVLAVIRGSAINNDGSLKVSYTAPSVDGQAEVIAAAQASADVNAESIGYIEAHGTATAIGDPIELTALTKVFRSATDKQQFCAIGSAKSNIGHLDAAAGVAGFIKTVLALYHRQLPPSPHFKTPNPKIDFDSSPFYVNTTLSEWTALHGPRRAGVSSFGVGGTNAHIILEEAPRRSGTAPAQGWQVLPLSARNAAALDRATANLVAYLRANPDVNLADVAYTLQVGRSVFRHRRAVICWDHVDALRVLTEGDSTQLLNEVDLQDPRARPLAWLFPGQGAQYVGMGHDLYQAEPVFRDWIDRCAELLKPHLGLDLRELLYPGELWMEDGGWRMEDRDSAILHPRSSILDQTQYAQPALFAVEYALAQLWLDRGVRPTALLGHSLGEYVAATLAGVMSLEDALALIGERGRLMQRLPKGAMVGVALEPEALEPLLGLECSLAAVNGPDRCTVAGPPAAVEALVARLEERGVTCRRLVTERAFHSPMVETVLPAFQAAVARVRLQPPQMPIVSNVTGTWLTDEQAVDPAYWARQMRVPVQFAAGLRTLAEEPQRLLMEVGPSTTLSSLVRQQSALPVISTMRHPQQQQPDTLDLWAATARLWLAGEELDWTRFHSERRRIPLPTYPFERQHYWIEPRARLLSAVQPQPAGVGKRLDMADWFYVPAWKRVLRMGSAADASTGSVLLFVDAWGIGAALAERLADLGHQVVTVAPGDGFARLSDGAYAVNPCRPDDYAALLAALDRRGTPPATMIHLWSLAATPEVALGQADADTTQALNFTSLLYLVQAQGQRGSDTPLRLVLVSNAIQNVGGESVLQVEKTPVLGLLRVISQEYLHISCSSIDLELPAQGATPATWLIEALADDCARAPAASTIAYRSRQRWVEQFERLPLTAARPEAAALRSGGTYLLIDGLDSIGFALAETIAQQTAGHLVLCEEAGFPERAAWADWVERHGRDDQISRKIRNAQALEAYGATVHIVGGNYAAEADLRRAVEQSLARSGALHGVIHCAGAGGEQRFCAIQELTSDEARSHLVSRAESLLALASALDGQPLDFCCLTSSLSTAVGGRGYAAYAAAHRFCDAFVRQHNTHSPTRWLSIGWDVWQLNEAIVQTALSPSLSLLALNAAEIGAVFMRTLAAPDLDHVLVSTGDLTERIAQDEQRIAGLRERVQQHDHEARRHPRPALPTDYVAPAGERERAIVAVWERTLGFEQIGVLDNFFDLGGDSLIAVRVVAQLKAALGIDLPVAQLYQGLTVRALAELIASSAENQEQRAAHLEERKEQLDRRRAFQKQQRMRRE